MNFPIELRQTAVRCRHEKLAADLRHTAKNLEDALLKLRLNPTTNNMVRVNGLWALGHKLKLDANKDMNLWGTTEDNGNAVA